VKYADLALKIRANDLPASTLKARALGAAGRRSDAEELLQSLPEIDSGGDAAELLLDLYLEAGEFEPACTLVTKIFNRDRKRFGAAHRVAAALLEANEFDRALNLLDLVREAMTDAGEHELLSQSLTRASERLPGRIEPREWLVELYGRASDSFRLPDALASLAEAYEAAGRPDRAQQTYGQLLDRTPDNEGVRRNFKRLQGMNGGHVALEEPPRVPAKETAPARGAANAEPALDEETQIFVSQSLTDVDLFSSYGLTQKAMDLLEVVLKRAPQHTPTLERLLDLSLGAGDEERIAEVASRLERIYSERGQAASAERFAHLRQRFERAGERGTKEAESASGAKPAEFSVPELEKPKPGSDAAAGPGNESSSASNGESSGEASAVEQGQAEMLRADIGEISSNQGDAGDAGGPDVHELDLSEEWAALAGQLEVPDSGEATAATASEFEVTAVPLDPEPASGAISEAISESPAAAEASQTPTEIPAASGEGAPEYVLEPAVTPEGSPLTADDFLESISGELDAVVPAESSATNSLPTTVGAEADEDLPRTSENETSPEDVSPELAGAQHTGPLNEIFDEFRAGLGETSDEEDPETHYNLGIAYREMGLAEESISEFQKVAQMVEREAARNLSKATSKTKDKRRVFRYAMQCYTLLGLAFMEKGEASIAAMWYARALETPGLDQDSVLALRYDLGVAQELAGDKEAARKSFSQVYGMNIDYRDVAERLAALGKGR
ncbi:MAG TPA: tetratricopeptide repeat protein, partial [Candidatus Acidoferrales bacterium]